MIRLHKALHLEDQVSEDFRAAHPVEGPGDLIVSLQGIGKAPGRIPDGGFVHAYAGQVISSHVGPGLQQHAEIFLAGKISVYDIGQIIFCFHAVPPSILSFENRLQPFIDELLRAYGDAEQKELTRADLADYQEYADDLADRRVDYYAAETIRRGVLELRSDTLTGQFDVLKEETFEGVKNTARSSKHANGYERMLAVMEQAAITPVTNYLLSASPYWISAKIKQGVCHHLVNANKLRWVKRRSGT